MADIEFTPSRDSGFQPLFGRFLDRLQNGKFIVRVTGPGWWRDFSVLYESLTLSEADTIDALYGSDPFTFLYDGETITARFTSRPLRQLLPGDRVDVGFQCREVRYSGSGSASWSLTESAPGSRVVWESGISLGESISGVSDSTNEYGGKNVGYLEWVTMPLTTSEYNAFLNVFNSNQLNEFDVVWPADNQTYHVWFGEPPFTPVRIGEHHVLTIQLEIRGRISNNFWTTEDGDPYVTEDSDNYVTEF